jgi:uncharacterized membrane protein
MVAAGSSGQQRRQVNPILLAHAAAITAMALFMMWAFTNYRLVPYRCVASIICISALTMMKHTTHVQLCIECAQGTTDSKVCAVICATTDLQLNFAK